MLPGRFLNTRKILHSSGMSDFFFLICRAERDERNLDREIRNEQEQAFQETLRRDQEREQRIAEEDMRRQEEAAEEERKRQEEERVRKAELDR